MTETIVADFGSEQKHGIYRDIPIHYTDRAGQHFRLRIAVDSITDEAGNGWRYRLEDAGRYQRIRIGDAERFVSGERTYRISYEVGRGAVRFFPDHDECYWNLTGNEWAVPIRRVHAAISLPASARGLRATGFVGAYGSTEEVQEVDILGAQVSFRPRNSFNAYEGLTAVVGWNKGAVHPPSGLQVLTWWLQDNWAYFIPIAVLGFMAWLWSQLGRDPRTCRSIPVVYEPPQGMTPAEVGALVDEQVDLRDVSATVIDLAVRGYLKIEPKRSGFFGAEDYRFIPIKPWQKDETLKPHEQTILKGIFGASGASQDLSALKYVFYTDLADARQKIDASLVKAGYFDGAPAGVRSRYAFMGAAFGVACYFALSAASVWHHLPALGWVIVSGLSAVIIIAFGRIMPRRTLRGAEVTDRIRGFVEFLKRTDQDRLQRINDPSLFERCLPYALAFGVADQWARAFEGIVTKAPSWYAGGWDHFSTRALVRDLDRSVSSMGQSFAATPRSSGSSSSWGGSGFGGGSSGGGGGGGGGGSW